MPARAWIVTGLGNEAPYLLEWISHYHGLGFEGVVLFTHGGGGWDRSDGGAIGRIGFRAPLSLGIESGTEFAAARASWFA